MHHHTIRNLNWTFNMSFFWNSGITDHMFTDQNVKPGLSWLQNSLQTDLHTVPFADGVSRSIYGIRIFLLISHAYIFLQIFSFDDMNVDICKILQFNVKKMSFYSFPKIFNTFFYRLENLYASQSLRDSLIFVTDHITDRIWISCRTHLTVL